MESNTHMRVPVKVTIEVNAKWFRSEWELYRQTGGGE